MGLKSLQKISGLISLLLVFFVMQSNGQTNLALSATPTQSGGGVNSTGYGPSNYNDGVIPNCGSTPWGWVSTNGWIEYEWSSAQTIQIVKFYKDNRPMTTCTIQYWDGSTYVNVQSYSNSVTCFDSVTFASAVTTTRLRFNSVAGSSNPNHREIEVYGPTCSTAVTQHPISKTICEGSSTSFQITGVDIAAYQWQMDEGSGFVNINNGTYYSGTTSNKLDINNAPFAYNGYDYRCMITKASCADSSNPVTLNVNGLVKLNDLPINDTTCINSIKELEVKATGSITNYQWEMYDKAQMLYVNVPNSPPYIHMGNVLRINGVPLSLDKTKFRVSVNGVCDSDVSSESLLAVNDVPNVAVPPADVNTKQGQSVKFEVKSTVTPARYQWQVATPNDTFVNINEGGIYIGARSNKLEVLGVTRVQNNFKFRCVVSTASSCAAPGDTSSFGILFVEPATSVETITGDGKLSLYPNPATDELYIQSSKSVSGMEYVVLDRTGRVVLAGKMSDAQDTRIDVSSLPSSMYIVKVLSADNQVGVTMKFAKL